MSTSRLGGMRYRVVGLAMVLVALAASQPAQAKNATEAGARVDPFYGSFQSEIPIPVPASTS